MKTFFLGTLLMFSSMSFAQQKPVPKPAPKPATQIAPAQPLLKNGTDSLSYAIGILDGNFFKSQGINKVTPALLGRGFSDVMEGKPLMTPEQANEVLQQEMKRMKLASIQPTIEEGRKFLAENRNRPGVKETPSGLQYEVITLGTGPKPADTSVVKVHYEGTLLNGRKFDSSRDRGEPITFSLNRVIRGWTEGLQLMPVGSRFKFYIPYQLAYGEQGSRDVIPGGACLVFDVELLDIVQNQ